MGRDKPNRRVPPSARSGDTPNTIVDWQTWVVFLDEQQGGGPQTPPPNKRPVRRSAAVQSSALAAAMLAVGEIIEPSNTHVEIVQEAPDGGLGLPLDLSFGDLPPLR